MIYKKINFSIIDDKFIGEYEKYPSQFLSVKDDIVNFCRVIQKTIRLCSFHFISHCSLKSSYKYKCFKNVFNLIGHTIY